MKRMMMVAGLALAAGGQALAADLPQAPPPMPRAPATYVPVAPPPYSWGGIYIGGNAGYAFGSGNATATITSGPLAGASTGTSSKNASGFAGGGQIGVNFQINAFVIGVEGDFTGSGQSPADSYVFGPATVGGVTFGPASITDSVKIPWFGTARARAGIAFDRVLVYGTGGAAWIHASDTITASAGGVSTSLFNPSSTTLGWTAGGGVEVAFAQNWTGRIEYLYMEANPTWSGTIPAVLGGGTFSESPAIHNNLIRAGINYKFNF